MRRSSGKGEGPVKVLTSLVLVVVVLAVYFLWLFPAIAPYMPFTGTPSRAVGSS